MEPSEQIDGRINYQKYKEIAKENLNFWTMASIVGYSEAKSMSMDDFLEAQEAFKILGIIKTKD